MLEWGGEENQKFFKAIREAGDPPHPAELRKPALSADCVDYYDAFRYLGASRTWNQGSPNPIAISEIQSYLAINEIDGYEKAKYMRMVKLLDQVELEHIQKKSKAPQ